MASIEIESGPTEVKHSIFCWINLGELCSLPDLKFRLKLGETCRPILTENTLLSKPVEVEDTRQVSLRNVNNTSDSSN